MIWGCQFGGAIQFAKLGGLRVLKSASSKKFNLVKGLGADEVFDYRDEGDGKDSRGDWYCT
jgi:NADPH-dependent curcumin reductase CurA